MCMGAEAIWVPLLMSAASAGVSAYNTNKTAKRQDAALADSVRNQAGKQREADAKVNAEVARLKESRSATDETQRAGDYARQLIRNRAAMMNGLNPTVGGAAVQSDSAQAAQAAQSLADQTAGLMAMQDSAGMQRQREGFDFGRLGTDLGLIGRESSGQQYIDQMRMRAIQRNPWLDIGSGILGGAAGAFSGWFDPNTMLKDSAAKIGTVTNKIPTKGFYGG